MLKRLLENYLINISEREIDRPFRLLLETEGHECLDVKTNHTALELGKDIITFHPQSGNFYAFQLKKGNIDKKYWEKLESQLKQLAELPIFHPNFSQGDIFFPIWVCTGELSPTIEISMKAKNEQYRNEGKPEIKVWNRNTLISKFHDNFFDILYIEENLLLDFIRVTSNISELTYILDEPHEFLCNFLDSIDCSNSRKIRKHLSVFVLIVYIIANRFQYFSNLYHSIDFVISSICIFVSRLIKNQLKENDYRNAISLLKYYLMLLLNQVSKDCKKNEDEIKNLFNHSFDLSEIFEFPLRVHSLASKIALLINLKSSESLNIKEELKILKDILENNDIVITRIITERQQGTFFTITYTLLQNSEEDLARKIIEKTFEWFLVFHSEEREGLSDPYKSEESLVAQLLGIGSDKFIPQKNSFTSHFLSELLYFAAKLDLKAVVGKFWKSISHFTVEEYYPEDELDFYTKIGEKGKMQTYQFPITGSWKKLKENFLKMWNIYMPITRVNPWLITCAALSFPWRCSWRIVDKYK